MMFSKIIIIVDDDINVSSISDVLWNLGNNIDPERDIVIAHGPADILDFSSLKVGFGAKIGIDATRKFPEELNGRLWLEKITQKIHPRLFFDHHFDGIFVACGKCGKQLAKNERFFQCR